MFNYINLKIIFPGFSVSFFSMMSQENQVNNSETIKSVYLRLNFFSHRILSAEENNRRRRLVDSHAKRVIKTEGSVKREGLRRWRCSMSINHQQFQDLKVHKTIDLQDCPSFKDDVLNDIVSRWKGTCMARDDYRKSHLRRLNDELYFLYCMSKRPNSVAIKDIDKLFYLDRLTMLISSCYIVCTKSMKGPDLWQDYQTAHPSSHVLATAKDQSDPDIEDETPTKKASLARNMSASKK
ncbi:hypothetical protein C5167_022104 [Papaver somniferum]|uniref:Uncharacterized protein n=1 Tax=Papaver somniferum TaxID=3469 RepID=A0A4Y7JGV2_PAPSO|nr:hypothetical protein C5167_022104 [Papaver somniferum]